MLVPENTKASSFYKELDLDKLRKLYALKIKELGTYLLNSKDDSSIEEVIKHLNSLQKGLKEMFSIESSIEDPSLIYSNIAVPKSLIPKDKFHADYFIDKYLRSVKYKNEHLESKIYDIIKTLSEECQQQAYSELDFLEKEYFKNKVNIPSIVSWTTKDIDNESVMLNTFINNKADLVNKIIDRDTVDVFIRDHYSNINIWHLFKTAYNPIRKTKEYPITMDINNYLYDIYDAPKGDSNHTWFLERDLNDLRKYKIRQYNSKIDSPESRLSKASLEQSLKIAAIYTKEAITNDEFIIKLSYDVKKSFHY